MSGPASYEPADHGGLGASDAPGVAAAAPPPPRPPTVVADDAPDGPPPPPTRARRHTRLAIEWVVILAVAVSAALLIRTFVLQPYFIPSGSMEPTLKIGDRVLVNKLSYDLHSVHRGDIVVFAKPPADVSPGIKDLIKRVIGLPGETISTQDNQVYIDGHPLAEPWLPKGQVPVPGGPAACALRTMTIPSGEYFMMGDNRGDSDDSRCFGPVPGKLIVGRAFLRVWPLSRLGTL